MKILFIALFFILLFSSMSFASKEVPFTIEDRDRLIRLETKVEEGLKAVNQRIDSLERLMYVLIGAVIAQTIGVIGFVLWDRRSALSPVQRKNKELEDRGDRIEKALKELAKEDERVAKALKSAGLL